MDIHLRFRKLVEGPHPTGPLTRLSVNLLPRAVAALDFAVELTGDSRTDTTNRALQVYAFVSDLQSRGSTLIERRADGSEAEITII